MPYQVTERLQQQAIVVDTDVGRSKALGAGGLPGDDLLHRLPREAVSRHDPLDLGCLPAVHHKHLIDLLAPAP